MWKIISIIALIVIFLIFQIDGVFHMCVVVLRTLQWCIKTTSVVRFIFLAFSVVMPLIKSKNDIICFFLLKAIIRVAIIYNLLYFNLESIDIYWIYCLSVIAVSAAACTHHIAVFSLIIALPHHAYLSFSSLFLIYLIKPCLLWSNYPWHQCVRWEFLRSV